MLPIVGKPQTVYRLRGTVTVNEYRDRVTDWSTPSRLEIKRCSFQPQGGEESLQDRDAITTRWEWFGPASADVLYTDRIEYRGVAYEVDGAVTAPEGLGLDHKHAICKRVEG